jgi:hypothetical protein
MLDTLQGVCVIRLVAGRRPERLGVVVRHVRRLVFEKRIPSSSGDNLLRFDPEEIEAWIDGSRKPPRS